MSDEELKDGEEKEVDPDALEALTEDVAAVPAELEEEPVTTEEEDDSFDEDYGGSHYEI